MEFTHRGLPRYVWACAALTLFLSGIFFWLYLAHRIAQSPQSTPRASRTTQSPQAIIYSSTAYSDSTNSAAQSFFDDVPQARCIQGTSGHYDAFESASHSFDRGNTQCKQIALTFDGGSNTTSARNILDTLASRNIRATMFLTGVFINRNQSIVARMIADQHEIGNHTYSHPHLTTYSINRHEQTLPTVTSATIAHELALTDSALFKNFGIHCAPLWRAPFGDINNQIIDYARTAGYTHVGWVHGATFDQSFDSGDWIASPDQPGYRTPKQLVAKFVKLAQQLPHGLSGGIILMHMGTQRTDSTQQTYRALGTLIDTLTHLGYSFKVVSQLLDTMPSTPVTTPSISSKKGISDEF